MLTIGKRWRSRARGDYAANCDLCGGMFPRSEMFRDRDGFLRCRYDADGKSSVELDEGNAAGSQEHAERSSRERRHDGTYYTSDDGESVRYTSREDLDI